MVIYKHLNGNLIPLATAPYPWIHNQSYCIDFSANGEELTLFINDEKLLTAKDDSFAYGMAGLALYEMGRCYFNHFSYGETTD